MLRMNRRNFLTTTSLALGAGAGLLPLLGRVRADPLPTTFNRKVVNITLEGGPDFRHLIVPAPNAGGGMYGPAYWKGRATSHYVSDALPSAWAARYSADYLPVTSIGGVSVPEFGVLASAGFLHAEIVAGRVAIMCNVEHSNNRDHSNSLLILQSGDMTTSSFATDRDGWGGRLAAHINGNVFSMTRQKLMYCNLPYPAPAGSQVISARNTRSFGLARSTPQDYQQGGEAVSDRALTSYYDALRQANAIAATSPYHYFVNSEESLRGFTNAVAARLSDNPVPAGIASLYTAPNQLLTRNSNFGEQIRNTYDCFACEGVMDTMGNPFNFRVASLEYGGWDSHKNQRDQIELQYAEIFGVDRGLSALRTALGTTMPAALDNYVVTVAGEFGRQLRSNGDRGTDHGRGNYIFVMGSGVRGGIYGEMFPMTDVTDLQNGQNRYERYNTDIVGQTSLARVFGAVTDWVANDNTAGDAIFPSRAGSIQEAGVTVDRASVFTT